MLIAQFFLISFLGFTSNSPSYRVVAKLYKDQRLITSMSLVLAENQKGAIESLGENEEASNYFEITAKRQVDKKTNRPLIQLNFEVGEKSLKGAKTVWSRPEILVESGDTGRIEIKTDDLETTRIEITATSQGV